jgi:hypothetical protein
MFVICKPATLKVLKVPGKANIEVKLSRDFVFAACRKFSRFILQSNFIS